MKFIVEREMFSKTKTGEQFPAIVVSKYKDYEKANKALREDRGFDYTKAAIRAYYGKERRGVFWIRESEYAEKFPEEYKVNLEASGLKPYKFEKTKKAQPKAEATEPTMADVMAELKALKKENATLKGQLTKMKKAASK